MAVMLLKWNLPPVGLGIEAFCNWDSLKEARHSGAALSTPTRFKQGYDHILGYRIYGHWATCVISYPHI
jgi:hypothetical protein